MSSLFGGGGGGDQDVTQTSEPWAGLQPYILAMLDNAAGIYNSGGPQYYPDSQVVPFSPQSQLGMEMMQNRILQGSPYQDAAGQFVLNTLAGNSSNPALNYLQGLQGTQVSAQTINPATMTAAQFSGVPDMQAANANAALFNNVPQATSAQSQAALFGNVPAMTAAAASAAQFNNVPAMNAATGEAARFTNVPQATAAGAVTPTAVGDLPQMTAAQVRNVPDAQAAAVRNVQNMNAASVADVRDMRAARVEDIGNMQAARIAPNQAVDVGQGLTGLTRRTFNDAMRGEYLNANPYLDQTFNRASDAVSRQWRESVMPGVNSTFSLAGRTGSGAHQNAVNLASEQLGDTLSDLGNQIYGQNYQSERERMMQAANSLGGFDTTEQGYGLQASTANAANALNRNINQANLVQDARTFNFGNDQQRALANAGYQQDARMFNIGNDQQRALANAGYQQDARQFNTGFDQTRALADAGYLQNTTLFNTGFDQNRATQNAGFRQEANQFNTGNAVNAVNTNAQNDLNAQMFNAGNQQAVNLANTGYNFDAGAMNTSNQQNMNVFNAGNQQAANVQNNQNAYNAGIFNAGNQQSTNLFNAGNQQAANVQNNQNAYNAGIFNAGNLQQNNQFNAGNQQQTNLANAGWNFNAGTQNTANQQSTNLFNAGNQQATNVLNNQNAYNTGIYNTGNQQSANQFNAGNQQAANFANAGNNLAAQQFNAGFGIDLGNAMGNAFQQNFGNQLAASNLGMSLGEQDFMDINRMLGLGGMVEGKANEYLGDQVNRWNYQQGAPERNLNWLAGLIAGNPAANAAGTQTNNYDQNDGSAFGNFVQDALMAYLMSSDITLKANITPKGKVNGFNWYAWTWNDKAKSLGLSGEAEGVIAQEVEKTRPDLVAMKDGYKAVNYMGVLYGAA